MKIALDAAMLKAKPPAAAFRSCAEAGYGHIELGNRDDFIPAFDAVRASSSDLAGIRHASSETGVEVVSVAVIQAWSSIDENLRTQAVSWWLEGIAAAVALGCTHVNTELSGDPNHPDECRAAFLRSVETLLPVLDREGVSVAIEPHPWDFLETTRAAVDLVRSVGSPRLKYLHCVPHTYYLGGSAAEQIEYARGWFDHAHVADTYRPERTIVNPPGLQSRIHQHFDIGKGELDWAQTAEAFRSAGFDGILTVQVFGWDERAEDSFRLNRSEAERLFGPAEGRQGIETTAGS
jgi:myo-inositol catabolism protein IolH